MKNTLIVLLIAIAGYIIYSMFPHYEHVTELYKTSVSEGNLIATFTSNMEDYDLATHNCESFVEAVNKSYPDEFYICEAK